MSITITSNSNLSKEWVSETIQKLDEIEKYLPAKEWARIKNCFHFLKGSASFLRHFDIVNQATIGESAAMQEDADKISLLIYDIRHSLSNKIKGNAYLKIEKELLSSIVKDLKELQSLQEQFKKNSSPTKLNAISYITNTLVEKSNRAEMGNINSITNDFYNMVKSIGKRLDKEIRFESIGTHIEIDRETLDLLREPLVHLIRNAIDHGLETPQIREDLGKERVGKITLKVNLIRNKVHISIIDDGAGIDFSKLKNKIKDYEVKQLKQMETDLDPTQDKMLEFLYKDGFSTKDKVTEISGRGIGMHAIKAVMDQIGGKIAIETEPNKGTTITLIFPLGSALTDVLVVNSGKDIFTINAEYIKKITFSNTSNIKSINKFHFLKNMNGEVVPLFYLNNFFSKEKQFPKGGMAVILFENFALMVDGVLGQEDSVIKPIIQECRPYYAKGLSILKNKHIAINLDLESMTQIELKYPEQEKVKTIRKNYFLIGSYMDELFSIELSMVRLISRLDKIIINKGLPYVIKDDKYAIRVYTPASLMEKNLDNKKDFNNYCKWLNKNKNKQYLITIKSKNDQHEKSMLVDKIVAIKELEIGKKLIFNNQLLQNMNL